MGNRENLPQPGSLNTHPQLVMPKDFKQKICAAETLVAIRNAGGLRRNAGQDCPCQPVPYGLAGRLGNYYLTG